MKFMVIGCVLFVAGILLVRFSLAEMGETWWRAAVLSLGFFFVWWSGSVVGAFLERVRQEENDG